MAKWKMQLRRPETWPTDSEIRNLILIEDMTRAIEKDASEAEFHASESRRMFCDGGAARLKWAREVIRQHLGVPANWRDVLARIRGERGERVD